MRQGAVLVRIFLLLFLALASAAPARAGLSNGLALLPPMGFNPWYEYGSSVNETLIKSIADQMATNGLLAAGYQYINLDDSWMGPRDTNSVITANPGRFPSGIPALAAYVHAKGFKFGLYTTGSSNTCGGYPGSLGHEEQDANTYASWGVDYVKYELCSLPVFEAVPHAQLHDVRMSQALLHCGRPMVFSCSIGSFENWMPNYINLWRGTGDIFGTWDTILSHIDFVAQTPAFAGPGGWNDADVLEIGNGAFNQAQSEAVFSMWCILSGPLLVMTSGSTATNILCNRDAIAVDQDPAGIQGICVATNGNLQVWRKPLGGSNSTTVAVVLLNRGSSPGAITANWSDLGLPAGVASVWDIWAQAYAGNATNSYTATIPGESVQFLRIVSGAIVPLPPVGTNFLSHLPVLANYTNTQPVRLDLNAAGQVLTLRGTNYTNGLGMTAYSRDDYFLGGTAARFQSSIGLDDASGTNAPAIFRVYADGTLLYDSGVLTTASPVQTVDLDMTGATRLTLEVTNVQTGITNDYCDWVSARIIVPPQPTDLISTPFSNAIDLSWGAPPGATGYDIFRSTTNGGPYSLIGTSATTAYADTNASPDIVYYYVVSALTTNGQTTNSLPATAELTPYWTNLATGAPQSWNAAGNWSNTVSFPNAVARPAIINAGINSNQTILLNQPITIGSLLIGSPNGSAAFTIAANGGSLAFNNGANNPALTQLSTSAGDTISAPLTFTGSLIVSNAATNLLTLSGSVSGNSLMLSGALTLGGSNSFAGAVSNTHGVLKIANSAALSGCSVINLPPGTTLDTSPLAAPGLTLTNGQRLVGGGAVNGNLTLGNGATLALNGASVVMNFSNSLTFNSGATYATQFDEDNLIGGLLVVSGHLTFGGSLQLTNISATPSSAGDALSLFSAASYSGAFASIIPPTPGPGLFWDASSLTNNGTLFVVPAGPLAIGNPKVSHGILSFNVSGGDPGAPFQIYSSTNSTLPLSQWSLLTSNFFDTNGFFVFTNAVNPGVPASYYRIQSQ